MESEGTDMIDRCGVEVHGIGKHQRMDRLRLKDIKQLAWLPSRCEVYAVDLILECADSKLVVGESEGF